MRDEQCQCAGGAEASGDEELLRRAVDESFNRIQTYSGFGYRWVSEPESGSNTLYLNAEPKSETASAADAARQASASGNTCSSEEMRVTITCTSQK